jgi:hypothetical protein
MPRETDHPGNEDNPNSGRPSKKERPTVGHVRVCFETDIAQIADILGASAEEVRQWQKSVNGEVRSIIVATNDNGGLGAFLRYQCTARGFFIHDICADPLLQYADAAQKLLSTLLTYRKVMPPRNHHYKNHVLRSKEFVDEKPPEQAAMIVDEVNAALMTVLVQLGFIVVESREQGRWLMTKRLR